jgi:hypothetical protein
MSKCLGVDAWELGQVIDAMVDERRKVLSRVHLPCER